MTPEQPPTRSRHHLAHDLSLRITAVAALILLAVITAHYLLSRQRLETDVRALAERSTQGTLQAIESVLHSAMTSADTLAEASASSIARSGAGENALPARQIRQWLQAALAANAHVYGMALALEAEFSPTGTPYAPYYYRAAGAGSAKTRIAFADLARKSYDYRQKDWYRKVKHAGHALWSEPYFDRGGGNALMVTYSRPLHDANKHFIGVATADIRLDWLDALIRQLPVSPSSFAFIVSRHDRIIAHPDARLHNVALQDAGLSQHNWRQWLQRKAGRDPRFFHTDCKLPGRRCWVAIRLPDAGGADENRLRTGWKVVMVIPEQEMLAGIRQLSLKTAALAAAGLLALWLTIHALSRRLTRPLSQLSDISRKIGEGALDTPVPLPEREDEIRTLAENFAAMQARLKQHIAALRDSVAREQKLASELEIAHRIQMSMLPGGGRADETGPGYRLYAWLQPARSVGGDLYHYRHIDEHLYFILGDVSDKGIPAALFMAKTVTLYSHALQQRLTPGQTLTMMNSLLGENNDDCMFVTALCGRLDCRNGELLIANAGHMPPLLRHNGTVTQWPLAGATALGLMPGIEYPDVSRAMRAGDSLVFYTDGITEAHDENGALYDEQRLLRLLKRQADGAPAALGARILADVQAFCGQAPPFDDITLLVLQYRGLREDE